MDSGISSAPPQRPSPPEIHDADAQAHGDLDKLLQDMMLTVESMPDPPNDDYSRSLRNGPSKMYIQESQPRGYTSQPSNSSTYSTLKDSYRSFNSSTAKESSPPYNSSSNYSTLKHNSRPSYDHVDYQRSSPDRKQQHSDSSFSPPGNIDFIDEDIPYHARQTSQPFSYGATNEMIKHQKLSSPSLVRKASVRGTAPVVDLDEILGESNGTNNRNARPISPLGTNTPDPPPEFANGPSTKSPNNDQGTDGMSWLKQQQLKLAARRDERSPAKLWRQETGNRMIGELRNVQRSRLRHDGYASDSAVLDDDDDVWTVNPMHGQSNGRPSMNTSAPASPLLPQRSASRKLNGSLVNSSASFNQHQSRPRAESVNERPFVAVKRAYEIRKYNDSHSPPLSGTATLLHQKYNGTSNGTANSNTPPRPESRSDSFARTESFLREHSRLLSSSLSNHSNGVVNHVAFDLDKEGSVSSRYPSRPESRNQYFGLSNGFDKKEPETGTTNGGLLAMVDQQNQQQQQQQNNPADPLVSLIQSLAEIRPLSGSVAASNDNTTTNNGMAKPEPSLLLHAQQQQQQATLITVGSSAINTFTNTPNQSPKAWQSSNTQSHNDSPSSWTERSVSPGSVQGMSGGSASRPQTPAFPVHPRTPYVNNSSPTVTFASDRPTQHQHHQQLAASNNMNHSVVGYVNNNNVSNNVEANNNNASYSADRAIFIEERREIRETGLPPKSPTTQRKDRPVSPLDELISHNSYGRGPGTPTHVDYGHSPKSAVSYTSINSAGGHSSHIQYYGSRRSSIHSNTEPHEVADANVKFVRDTSKIWYKPNISREQAIAMLRDAAPGTFVVRDSNSFPGAFGLALKVAHPPPGAPSSPKDPSNELVRHFLIEPTSRGVRLKGCANEPVFSSLSALVYQHSLMAMALPCQLLLPEPEAAARALDSPAHNSPQQLLAQGAACNVLYLFTMDTESLTGPQAIKKTITMLFDQKPRPSATIVHFKVSTQGITLTDNARKLFFRRHYPTNNISYCGLDTEERTWDFVSGETGRALSEHRCFGFVARKPAHKSDNQCHIFAELEPEQPATAIVNFVNKVMMGSAHIKANIV